MPIKSNLDRFFSHFPHTLFLYLLAVSILVSCNSSSSSEKNEPKQPLWVGQYQLKSAVLTSDADFQGLTKGTDVSQMIKTAFFSVHECTSSGNIALDLKMSNELYFVCLNENNEAKAGTWSSKLENTELRLNLARPLFPISYALSVKDIEFNDTGFSGNSVFLPIPRWIVEGDTPPEQNPLENPSDPKNEIIGDFNVSLFFSKI